MPYVADIPNSHVVRYKKWKTNWCHFFNFIHISTDLYMFRAHRPIFRRIRTAVPTTIGSVSVPFWTRVLSVQNGTDTEPMVVWTAVRIFLKMGLWARNMYRSVDIWIKLKQWHQLVFHFLCWKDVRYKKLKIYLSIIFYKFNLLARAASLMCAARPTVWLLVHIVRKVRNCRNRMGAFYIYIVIMVCVVAYLQHC